MAHSTLSQSFSSRCVLLTFLNSATCMTPYQHTPVSNSALPRPLSFLSYFYFFTNYQFRTVQYLIDDLLRQNDTCIMFKEEEETKNRQQMFLYMVTFMNNTFLQQAVRLWGRRLRHPSPSDWFIRHAKKGEGGHSWTKTNNALY